MPLAASRETDGKQKQPREPESEEQPGEYEHAATASRLDAEGAIGRGLGRRR